MRISDWSSDVCSSDLAEALRLDAESLKAEYEAKLADAAKEADEMRARADSEAEALVAKAKADATALITRRKPMVQHRHAPANARAPSSPHERQGGKEGTRVGRIHGPRAHQKQTK